MDFADILDGIARPSSPDEGAHAGARSPDFRRILESLAASAPAGEAVRQAYFDSDSAQLSAAGLREDGGTPGEVGEADLSIDPEDVAFDLDLGGVASLEELSALRRRFAMLNHPDRVPASLRERANIRMTLANALIDKAALRFAA